MEMNWMSLKRSPLFQGAYFTSLVLVFLAMCYSSVTADIMVQSDAHMCKGHGEPVSYGIAMEMEEFFSPKEHLAPSRIICSMLSVFQEAFGFSYEDGKCTLYGSGEGQNFVSRDDYFVPFETSSDLEEVATKKETYASPSWNSYDFFHTKSWAVDGNYYEDWLSPIIGVSVSEGGIMNPWWIVDLGEDRNIHQIQIFPRPVVSPFYNIEVRIGTILKTDGNLLSYTLVSRYTGPFDPNTEELVMCTGFEAIQGRYVSIQKFADPNNNQTFHELLQLLEVNVYAERK